MSPFADRCWRKPGGNSRGLAGKSPLNRSEFGASEELSIHKPAETVRMTGYEPRAMSPSWIAKSSKRRPATASDVATDLLSEVTAAPRQRSRVLPANECRILNRADHSGLRR